MSLYRLPLLYIIYFALLLSILSMVSAALPPEFEANYDQSNFYEPEMLRYPLRVERLLRRSKPWYLNIAARS
ncbi:unnamed protein product [Bursaphelenchus xylophilus]|uniref:(pine wood nematode) hypothetical protein n=1 Tax=Bursaphelenchus xylophilus TaxID=6326 RepID=A0A1I7RKN2_BURXY|nr:unnamed protein product [Bursaphelenchus xylophilus]CAG9131210.1 unnamed protein product [Bursaphelenchus xylophilus]